MKVFISHANEDKHEASVLHDRFGLIGLACFLAHRDISIGTKWRDEIVRELKASDVFIPILTVKALASAWVHQECGMAHLLRTNKKSIRIIPLIVACDAPPGCISEYQAVKAGTKFLGWSDKVKMEDELTLILAAEIVRQSAAPETIRASAVANLRGTNWNNAQYILQFLYQTKELTYGEFVDIISACRYNFAVAASDAAMWYMFRFLEWHKSAIDQDPSTVKAWNEIYHRYDARKKEESRLLEEARQEREKQQRELTPLAANKPA